jgi:hypothetical protein
MTTTAVKLSLYKRQLEPASPYKAVGADLCCRFPVLLGTLVPPRGNGLHRMMPSWVPCSHLEGIESFRRLNAERRAALK